jgi:hypothetical protein
MLCGAADGRDNTAVQRKPEWARWVRAGADELGRRDQPGEGGLCNFDDMALHGLCGSIYSWFGTLAFHAVERWS